MKNTANIDVHKEAIALARKLLEVRLLLIDLKQAMEQHGFRPDLVKKIEARMKP